MVMQFARVVVDDDGYNQQVDDGCGRRLLDHWDRETSESRRIGFVECPKT